MDKIQCKRIGGRFNQKTKRCVLPKRNWTFGLLLLLGSGLLLGGGIIFLLTMNIISQGDLVMQNPLVYTFVSDEARAMYFASLGYRTISYLMIFCAMFSIIGALIISHRKK